MPKFFNARDLDFIKTIAEEVVDYVVEQAVVLFKVSVGETKTNLYGESLGKVWHAPATLMSIVDREPSNVVYEGFGGDKSQLVEFRFNRQQIKRKILLSSKGKRYKRNIDTNRGNTKHQSWLSRDR